MAETHKRQFAHRDRIVWVVCYRTVMPWENTSWCWGDVTCGHCRDKAPLKWRRIWEAER